MVIHLPPDVLAANVSKFIYNSTLLRCSFIYSSICPLATSVIKNKLPHLVNTVLAYPVYSESENLAWRAYENFYQTHDFKGVIEWLRVIHTLKDVMNIDYVLFSDWTTFLSLSRKITNRQISELEIPFIESSLQDSSHISVRTVSVGEYMTFFSITPLQFIYDIIQFIVFGIPINEYNRTCLRMKTDLLLPQMEFRIEQGDYDSYMRLETETYTSFRNLKPKKIPVSRKLQVQESLSRYLSGIGKDVTRGVLPDIPKDVYDILKDAVEIGPNEEISIKNLARMRAFDKRDERYSKYLRRRLGRNTIPYGATEYNRRIYNELRRQRQHSMANEMYHPVVGTFEVNPFAAVPELKVNDGYGRDPYYNPRPERRGPRLHRTRQRRQERREMARRRALAEENAWNEGYQQRLQRARVDRYEVVDAENGEPYRLSDEDDWD